MTDSFILDFVIFFLVAYVMHTLGISIGYHRLLSHRSYRCPKLVEYFWVACGYLGFQSSPIWWATMHRAHHRYSDTPLDPHANLYGWRRSIYGWIFDEHYPDHVDPEVCGKDLISDPVYRFLDQGGDVQRAHLLNGFSNFLFRFVILYFFGLGAALGSLAGGLLLQQMALIFNKVSHIQALGYRNFNTTDDSINNPWLGLFTLGEGLHNNHHACPGSANNALAKGEFDFSFQVVKVMKQIGFATWVNDGARERARLAAVSAPVVAAEPLPVESAEDPVIEKRPLCRNKRAVAVRKSL